MTQSTDDAPAPTGAMPTLFAALVHGRAVTATYNRGTVTLAPHVLYTRHGEVHLDAVPLERDGKPPKEEKLGVFKLDGLGDITLTDRPFVPSRLFRPAAERYAGVTLMAVEL